MQRVRLPTAEEMEHDRRLGDPSRVAWLGPFAELLPSRSPRLWIGTCVVFGIVAPLVYFGALVFCGGAGTASLSFSCFVLLCVSAMTISLFRAWRADRVDTALDGMLLAALVFAAPFALGFAALAAVWLWTAPSRLENSVILIPALVPSASAFVFWAQWLRRRQMHVGMDRFASVRMRWTFAPGAACLVLFFAVNGWATLVERAVVASPESADIDSLAKWRWLAPGHDWDALRSAYRESEQADAARSTALGRAYVALTGVSPDESN